MWIGTRKLDDKLVGWLSVEGGLMKLIKELKTSGFNGEERSLSI